MTRTKEKTLTRNPDTEQLDHFSGGVIYVRPGGWQVWESKSEITLRGKKIETNRARRDRDGKEAFIFYHQAPITHRILGDTLCAWVGLTKSGEVLGMGATEHELLQKL